MRRRKKQPAEMHLSLAPAVRQLVRNLMVTTDGTVWAGYRMGPARWDFLSDDAKAFVLEQSTDAWATLLGRDVQERVTMRPYPVTAWAKALDERTPLPPNEDDWNDHLVRMQERVQQAGMDDRITYRYFTVGTVESDTDVLAEVVAHVLTGAEPSEQVRKVLAEEKRVADAVAAPAWRGVRMTDREQGWLRARSLAPGLVAPISALQQGWESPEQMRTFESDVRWHEEPFDRGVKVTAWRNGEQIIRHVQVLTLARSGDHDYPDSGLEPWQAFADRALDSAGVPFSVEWNIVGRLTPGEELNRRAELDYAKAKSLAESYRLHEEEPPQYTMRGIAVADEIKDQVSTGVARESGRFIGTINVLVTGDTPVQMEERADALRRLYGGNALRMEFHPPHGQALKLREFVPGEPVDARGYQRQIRLDYLANGLPNVSQDVGDARGPYVGYTRGSNRQPVMHDPHFTTEGRGELGRGQALWIIAGTLGSGKSVLQGLIAYEAAIRRTRTVIRDPSGPLARLCELPEIKPFARAINLLESPRGTLSPPSLVRDPQRREFVDDAAWEQARALAAGERRALTIDTARRCLDWDLYANPETTATLRAAADGVHERTGWGPQTTLWDVMEAASALGTGSARDLVAALRSAADMPILNLLFPFPGDEVEGPTSDTILTIVSTPGIKRAGDESPREDWSPQELAADPVLRLTARFTDRLLFQKAMSERALIILDEAEDVTDTGAGRALLSRLGRDHSKWNIAVYLGLKNVTDQMMGTELRNFVAGAFVGKQAARDPAVEMLRVLNVEDQRYATDLMALGDTAPGEFVHLDAFGRVGAMRVDVDYHEALRGVLLTNPTPEGSTAWNPAEEDMA